MTPAPHTCVLRVLALLDELESQWERCCALTLQEIDALGRWQQDEVGALGDKKRAVMASMARGVAERRAACVGLWVSSGLPLEAMPHPLPDWAGKWREWAMELEEEDETHPVLLPQAELLGHQIDRLCALKAMLDELQHTLEARLGQSLEWVESCLEAMTAPAAASGGLYTRYGKGRVTAPCILEKRA